MEKSIKVKFEKSGVPYGYAYSPGDVCEMPMSKFKELSNKKVVSEMATKEKPQKPTNETPPKTKQIPQNFPL